MININVQSSIKIGNIYFDPFKIEDYPKDARIIFITHSHYDHFDFDSIKKIENENTVFVIPNDSSIKERLKDRKIFIVEPNREYIVDDIKFKTVPAYNINKSYHKKEYGWVGYVVYLDKIYYIMGDTDNIKEAENIKCDYLFIPIGGTYTMNYEEAAELTNIIKPKIVIPTHYGSIVGDKDDYEKFIKLVNNSIKTINILK